MRYRRIPAMLAVAALSACSPPAAELYSGTVQSPSAAVGSTIGGRVTAVLAQDGARVGAGQVLVRLDDAQLRAQLAQAREQSRAAAATLADLIAGPRPEELDRARAQAAAAREAFDSARATQAIQIRIARGSLAQAQAQLADARAAAADAAADAGRTRRLYATGDVSAQSRDAADAKAARAAAQVAAAAAAVANARRQVRSVQQTAPRASGGALATYDAAAASSALLAAGSRPQTIAQAKASLAAARAAEANAAARLAETVVRAPAAGTIAGLDLHPGDLVAAGAAVATVEEDGEPYVRIFVPQARVGRLRVGSAVNVHPDARPGTTLGGSVEEIDTRAQFTPQNVQTADDRAQLAYGVKVRIHDRAQPLPAGTTAGVTLP